MSSRLTSTSLQLSAVDAGPHVQGHVHVRDRASKISESFYFAYSIQYHEFVTSLTLPLKRACSITVPEVKDVSSRTARKVAFYAPSPYKNFPVGTTNLETYIFWQDYGRSESGGYREDAVVSSKNLGWTAGAGVSGGSFSIGTTGLEVGTFTSEY